jgi:aminoglycoside 6-adenylyltransferase
VAKGIARDELPYVMEMLYHVRGNLTEMIEWYIGVTHGFNISAGKDGKYFKKYLPPELYEKYTQIYSGSNYSDIWKAIFTMCDLFRTVSLAVAEHFSFEYRQDEEAGIREYIRIIRNEAHDVII